MSADIPVFHGIDPLRRMEIIRELAQFHDQQHVPSKSTEHLIKSVPSTRFDHLVPRPDIYGTVDSGLQIVHDALSDYLTTGETQFIGITGPQGTGKTQTAVRVYMSVVKYLQAWGLNKQLSKTIVTSENAQEAGKLLFRDGKSIVNPTHRSGKWSPEDFTGGTQIFARGAYLAGIHYPFVILEGPATTGYSVTLPNGEKESRGNDRCTTAFMDLSNRQGIFSTMRYGLRLIVMTAHPDRYKENIDSRVRDAGEAYGVIPGGTVIGTQVGNTELKESSTLYFRATGQEEAARLNEETGDIDLIRLGYWGRDIIPWILGPQNLNVQPENVIVYENRYRARRLSTLNMNQHSFIPMLQRKKDQRAFRSLAMIY